MSNAREQWLEHLSGPLPLHERQDRGGPAPTEEPESSGSYAATYEGAGDPSSG